MRWPDGLKKRDRSGWSRDKSTASDAKNDDRSPDRL
jgi:hypothetical protein